MPTIIPGYVYSLFAALIVGSIIVYCCSLSALNIKNEATNQQLGNINEYVAAQTLALISHTNENNQNTTQFLDIPTTIDNQRFWINLENLQSGAVVESGFGTQVSFSESHVNIPAQILASGTFVSGSGRAVLLCHFVNDIVTIMLTTV